MPKPKAETAAQPTVHSVPLAAPQTVLPGSTPQYTRPSPEVTNAIRAGRVPDRNNFNEWRYYKAVRAGGHLYSQQQQVLAQIPILTTGGVLPTFIRKYIDDAVMSKLTISVETVSEVLAHRPASQQSSVDQPSIPSDMPLASRSSSDRSKTPRLVLRSGPYGDHPAPSSQVPTVKSEQEIEKVSTDERTTRVPRALVKKREVIEDSDSEDAAEIVVHVPGVCVDNPQRSIRRSTRPRKRVSYVD